MGLDRRQSTYLLVRCGAGLLFVVAALALPRGPLAGLVVMAAGLIAVVSCLWANAGGPGERAGARPQDRAIQQLRAPQGDWPPYAPETVVDGELADRANRPGRPGRVTIVLPSAHDCASSLHQRARVPEDRETDPSLEAPCTALPRPPC